MNVFWILVIGTFKSLLGYPNVIGSDPSYSEYSYKCTQVIVFESSGSLVNYVNLNGIKTGYKVFSGGEYMITFTPKIEVK